MIPVFPGRAPCAMAVWTSCIWVSQHPCATEHGGPLHLSTVTQAHASRHHEDMPVTCDHHPSQPVACSRVPGSVRHCCPSMVVSCCASRTAHAPPPLHGTATTRVQPPRLAVLALGVHADDHLAEVASLQQAEKGFGRLLQAVDDILAVADTAIGDTGTDLAQECRIVCFSTFMVEEAAQRQALRENLAH